MLSTAKVVSSDGDDFKRLSGKEKFSFLKINAQPGEKGGRFGAMLRQLSDDALWRECLSSCIDYHNCLDMFDRSHTYGEYVEALNTLPGNKVYLSATDECTLHHLTLRYSEAGYAGRCICLFDPIHYREVMNLPNFRFIDDYKYTEPLVCDEIGFTELFHFSPSEPLSYRKDHAKDHGGTIV